MFIRCSFMFTLFMYAEAGDRFAIHSTLVSSWLGRLAGILALGSLAWSSSKYTKLPMPADAVAITPTATRETSASRRRQRWRRRHYRRTTATRADESTIPKHDQYQNVSILRKKRFVDFRLVQDIGDMDLAIRINVNNCILDKQLYTTSIMNRLNNTQTLPKYHQHIPIASPAHAQNIHSTSLTYA